MNPRKEYETPWPISDDVKFIAGLPITRKVDFSFDSGFSVTLPSISGSSFMSRKDQAPLTRKVLRLYDSNESNQTDSIGYLNQKEHPSSPHSEAFSSLPLPESDASKESHHPQLHGIVSATRTSSFVRRKKFAQGVHIRNELMVASKGVTKQLIKSGWEKAPILATTEPLLAHALNDLKDTDNRLREKIIKHLQDLPHPCELDCKLPPARSVTTPSHCIPRRKKSLVSCDSRVSVTGLSGELIPPLSCSSDERSNMDRVTEKDNQESSRSSENIKQDKMTLLDFDAIPVIYEFHPHSSEENNLV